MAALCLEPDYRRKEWIDDHCPSLQGAAEGKCSKGGETKWIGHSEAQGESTYGQSGGGQGQKEQESSSEAQSVDACISWVCSFLSQSGIDRKHRDQKQR